MKILRPLISITLLSVGSLSVAQDSASPKPPAPSTGTASAATTKSASPATPKKAPQKAVNSTQAQFRAVALTLLERSHAFDDQLLVGEHLSTLQRQIRIASKLDLNLARGWADEFMEVSNYLPDADAKVQLQAALVWNLSSQDANYALELLHKISAPSSPTDGRDGRTFAAGNLFAALLEKNGDSAVPQIHDEAIRLGSQDAYPYSAMGQLALQLAKTPRPATKATPVALFNPLQICREAIEFYQRSPRSLSGDLDFEELMREVADALPADLKREALRSLVFNLMASAADLDLNKTTASSGSSGSNESAVSSRNLADGALIRISGEIKTSDPELYNQVKQSRPAVAQLDSPTPGIALASLGDTTSQNLNAISAAAASNPSSALALSQGLSNTSPSLSVDATSVLAESDKTIATQKNKEAELESLIIQAQAASKVHNAAVLRQSLSRGFEVGDGLLRSEQDQNSGGPVVNWDSLAGLVQVGMESEPELTVSHIDQLSVPVAQANLLIIAADALLSHPAIASAASPSRGPSTN